MDFYEQHAYDEESEAMNELIMKLVVATKQMAELKSMIFAREQTQAVNSYNPWPVHEPFEHSHSQWSSYEPYDNTYNPNWRNNQNFSWSNNEINTYKQMVSPSLKEAFNNIMQSIQQLWDVATTMPSYESWDNKIYMMIEYGNGRALSPPPPPKPASPTRQIITSCDSENNQCTQFGFIKSDHKRKNSPPPPPPPKSSPSPHEVTRPAPPPPKLPSSSPRPGIKMLQVL
ncbi:hypothetical protein LWI29_038084 [Acer saccharum]|uniref:Uncharacterized protein n=1 Tax=Acer saccharum TaxID=4024 RepID=A0AA39W1H3_ACESA|nr:hypothetical protein LWI29_038084 [Acer saccharum]